jgi:NAD(P)-dependent dehydrogenase (short-subunit alcohol dehydrogenase family)
MRVAEEVVVVTGAGSGIGREVALEALRRRARVAACDINAESLAATARLANAGERLSTSPPDEGTAPRLALPNAIPAKGCQHLR